jgi:hypothetical protein
MDINPSKLKRYKFFLVLFVVAILFLGVIHETLKFYASPFAAKRET